MPSPHRDYAAETAVERQAQDLHLIAKAAEDFRLALARLGNSRQASIALTHIDTAELFAESIVRNTSYPMLGGGGL